MTVKAILSTQRQRCRHRGSQRHARRGGADSRGARIGAVVVTGADRRIVGILSERDVVRVLGEQGPAALETPISEVMTRKVIDLQQRDTVAELMERMTDGQVPPRAGGRGRPARRHRVDRRRGEVARARDRGRVGRAA